MEHDGTQWNGAEGNTSTSAPRVTPSKYWCFTLNNYTMEQLEHLEHYFKKTDTQYIMGLEGQDKTPHIQGYVEFKKRLRPRETIKIKEIHWERCKGTKEQNIKYCSKEGNYRTNMEIEKPLEDPMEGLTFYEWQTEILDMIKTKPDKRKIYWYYDEKGGAGKTTFVKHVCMKYPKKSIFINGKANDIKCAIASLEFKPEICIFHFTRSVEDYVSYEALESVKDGIFFSGKYESSMFIMNCPHVLVFANFLPNEDKLSKDRWIIKNLTT